MGLSHRRERQEMDLKLSDLDTIAILGVGGFGKVKLVRSPTGLTYALKAINKHHVVETSQQNHVQNERNIMISCNSNFLVRCFRSFRDEKFVYLLQEPCMGGELFTLLRDRELHELAARFYAACVVEALQYLHERNIIYRDIKPENMLIDERGYLKLVDFGFAKQLDSQGKTHSFCGTPEYIAPEVLLGKQYSFSADYWSLGVLIFELITGNPPFNSSRSDEVYIQVIRGVDSVDFGTANISPGARHIFKALCRRDPNERLGIERGGFSHVKRHIWFALFDWEGLRSYSVRPPYIPKIKSSTDTSNFDPMVEDNRALPPDELSGWDKDF